MILKFIKSSFFKVKETIGEKIKALFAGPIDATMEKNLQKLLIEADLGRETTDELLTAIKLKFGHQATVSSSEILEHIEKELLKKLPDSPLISHTLPLPQIYLLLGVNGSGKTTTSAKLAHLLKKEGKNVLLVAADTYRAAATEQLLEWAKRLEIETVHGKQGADSAAVVFDALKAAQARNKDVVIIDTAGRLHTRIDLMGELKKIKQICGKVLPTSPCHTLLVLDATLGQNALEQAKIFNSYTDLTGLILTKLDGSAKGGVAIAIQRSLMIPLHYIGTGEGFEDLVPYNKELYINQLLKD
jgi:fused signal recognition particle receptor